MDAHATRLVVWEGPTAGARGTTLRFKVGIKCAVECSVAGRRVTVRDAERFAQAAETVERRHPALVGGIGVYTACCGHGPFTHIDVRGYRARWRGTGNG